MNTNVARRIAALLEVLAVYLGGALLNDWIVAVPTRHRIISSQNPFALLTLHASNSDLLVASRQLFLALVLIYFSFFVIIVPLDWWRGRRGAATYGLTRAGRPAKALVVAGIVTAALAEWPCSSTPSSTPSIRSDRWRHGGGILLDVVDALAVLALRSHP